MEKEVLVLGLILVCGCLGQGTPETQRDVAIRTCTQLCGDEVEGGLDISEGPCLSDDPSWNVDDWVCDVAHDPRQEVDNDPANQCQAYRQGEDSHFVEVDQYCQVIRAV